MEKSLNYQISSILGTSIHSELDLNQFYNCLEAVGIKLFVTNHFLFVGQLNFENYACYS